MNVLMIYCDELRADVFGFAGHPIAQTPHLDGLAARSVAFERCYVPCPVCMPSRGALATGRYARSNGCVDNATLSIVGEAGNSLYRLFAEAGWRVENVGKYQLPWALKESGFSFHESHDDGFSPFGSPDPRWRAEGNYGRLDGDLPIVIWGESPIPAEESKAALTVDAAVARLAGCDRRTPFFLRVSINMPHTPYAPPRPYSSLYDWFKMDVPPSWLDDIETKPTLVQLFHSNRRYDELTADDVRRTRASYLGLVTYIDDQIGRVLSALRESAREDDTVVVFTSDHGACLGEHGWIEKWAQLWEETCRVPLLLAVPGCAPGRCGALTQQIDLAPALLDLCDIATPETMQGRSLVPLLSDPSREFRDAVFAETFIPGLMTEPACSVRTREWKLTDYPRMADIEARLPVDHPRRMHAMFSPERLVEGELYDLRSDPGEVANLLGSRGRARIEATLRARLDVWKRECEPTVDWSALRPPDGFAWSQQRMIEGATTRRIASVWGSATQATRIGTPACIGTRANEELMR